jgi:hypothetical protein
MWLQEDAEANPNPAGGRTRDWVAELRFMDEAELGQGDRGEALSRQTNRRAKEVTRKYPVR